MRSLRDELRDSLGVRVSLATEREPHGHGYKGGTATDLLLWASLGAAGSASASMLLSSISSWCARERSRRVELTLGGRSMCLAGRPDECAELVRSLPRDLRETA
ncbi:effector-associated constant component EACC1 [Saccharopolyspora gloriosae]|uniref:effector-associated constant component EACC1 n=1 Tax=Saccharopolyspora gloriosae TaxID=455344 RepID=UPI001FB66483|nr:hypothetical protein [Saccharopolyspora gloriosae]